MILNYQLTTTMKTKLTLLLLVIPFYLFTQTNENLENKTISGFISHANKPLSNVTVFVENTTRFSVSDAKGFYNIKAKVGETLNFSFIGLEKINVLIEDVTSLLNINLKLKNKLSQIEFKKELKLGESSIGDNITNIIAARIDGTSLNKKATSLIRAIQEKIPSILIRYNDFGEEIAYVKGKELKGPIIWEIDKVIFDVPFPVYISEVKEVLVFINDKTKSIIKVNTSINYKTVKGINFGNYYFSDEEFYNYDAILYKKLKTKTPFLDKYKKISKASDILNLYTNTYSEDKNITNFHFSIFNYFKKEKPSKTLLLKVLSDYEEFSNNPEDLKAIAYKYQELNENEKALSVYRKIIKLRPNYLQSYRDVANTFLEINKYKDVWLTYNYFLNKGFKIEDNDISAIISSEIISTYNLDKVNDSSSQKININDPTKNTESDLRLVFEWNITEAEFIIEFVNPDLEIYEIENSAAQNQYLIIDQKKKGYTSKEIFIDELVEGNYLVNLTYLGNKQYKPTVFKITTYYNWGKPNQSKKIDVFDFTKQNKKVQLLKLNRRKL